MRHPIFQDQSVPLIGRDALLVVLVTALIKRRSRSLKYINAEPIGNRIFQRATCICHPVFVELIGGRLNDLVRDHNCAKVKGRRLLRREGKEEDKIRVQLSHPLIAPSPAPRHNSSNLNTSRPYKAHRHRQPEDARADRGVGHRADIFGTAFRSKLRRGSELAWNYVAPE
jgi:hypothetical protein